jgi:Recombination endonuclease VII
MRKSPRRRPFTSSERKIRQKERMYEYYLSNKDKLNSRSREWLEKNREYKKEYQRNRNYLNEHKITLEEAKLMLKNQNNRCAICEELISIGGVLGAHVDHNHITNEIRGILCHNCNNGLGHFRDNINTLLKAISFLKRRKFILIVSPFEKVG